MFITLYNLTCQLRFQNRVFYVDFKKMSAEEQKIEKLQEEVNRLREELQQKERQLYDLKFKKVTVSL